MSALPEEIIFTSGFDTFEGGNERVYGLPPTDFPTSTINGVTYKHAGLYTWEASNSGGHQVLCMTLTLTADALTVQSIPEDLFSHLIVRDPKDIFFLYLVNNPTTVNTNSGDGGGLFPLATDFGGTGTSKVNADDASDTRRYRQFTWRLDLSKIDFNIAGGYGAQDRTAPNFLPYRFQDGMPKFRFSTEAGQEFRYYIVP